jgi:hypothetical protein
MDHLPPTTALPVVADETTCPPAVGSLVVDRRSVRRRRRTAAAAGAGAALLIVTGCALGSIGFGDRGGASGSASVPSAPLDSAPLDSAPVGTDAPTDTGTFESSDIDSSDVDVSDPAPAGGSDSSEDPPSDDAASDAPFDDLPGGDGGGGGDPTDGGDDGAPADLPDPADEPIDEPMGEPGDEPMGEPGEEPMDGAQPVEPPDAHACESLAPTGASLAVHDDDVVLPSGVYDGVVEFTNCSDGDVAWSVTTLDAVELAVSADVLLPGETMVVEFTVDPSEFAVGTFGFVIDLDEPGHEHLISVEGHRPKVGPGSVVGGITIGTIPPGVCHPTCPFPTVVVAKP